MSPNHLYNSFPIQFFKVHLTDPQLAKYGGIVGAQYRRSAFRARVSAGQTEAAAHGRQGPVDAGNIRDGLDEFALLYLAMIQDIRHGHDAAGRNAVSSQEFFPFKGATGGERALDFRGQGYAVPLARFPVGESLVGGKVFAVEQLAEGDELFLLVRISARIT